MPRKKGKNIQTKTTKELAIELLKGMPNSIEWSDVTSIFYKRKSFENTLIDALNKGILTRKETEKRLNMLNRDVLVGWLKSRYDNNIY